MEVFIQILQISIIYPGTEGIAFLLLQIILNVSSVLNIKVNLHPKNVRKAFLSAQSKAPQLNFLLHFPFALSHFYSNKLLYLFCVAKCAIKFYAILLPAIFAA